MEVTYILFSLLIALIIYLYIELDKLKKRVLVEGMAGALSDEAIQNIATLYNNNGTLTVPNLKVTGEINCDGKINSPQFVTKNIFVDRSAEDWGSCIDLKAAKKEPAYISWFDNAGKRTSFNMGTWLGLETGNDFTVNGGNLNANKDVNVGGNANITGTIPNLNLTGNINFTGDGKNIKIIPGKNTLQFSILDGLTAEVFHYPNSSWGIHGRNFLTFEGVPAKYI